MSNTETAEQAAKYAQHIMNLEKELRQWVLECVCQRDSIRHSRGCGTCKRARKLLRMPV